MIYAFQYKVTTCDACGKRPVNRIKIVSISNRCERQDWCGFFLKEIFGNPIQNKAISPKSSVTFIFGILFVLKKI